MYQILLLLILSFNCSKVKSDKKYSINNLYYKDSLIHSISNDKIISGYIYQDIPKKWVELIQQKNDLDVMGYIKDGKPDGSFSILYDNGSIIGDSTKYLSWETKIDGKNKDGYFTEYYDDGKLIDIISTSEIFSVGVNYEKLFECGELICNSTFGLDNYGETIDLVPYSGNVYELNDDGKKILTGSYEDGRKSGEWIFWDNDVKSILVKNNLQTMTILEAHIMEHMSLQAREEVEQEMQKDLAQIAQKFGGNIPQEEQVKLQELVESKVAERITEMTEKMITEEQEMLSSQGEDPLINLKQQEIQLRAADLQRKSALDQANIEMDAAKLEQNAKLAQDKIDSQEDIAQLRANVNLSKQNDQG